MKNNKVIVDSKLRPQSAPHSVVLMFEFCYFAVQKRLNR